MLPLSEDLSRKTTLRHISEYTTFCHKLNNVKCMQYINPLQKLSSFATIVSLKGAIQIILNCYTSNMTREITFLQSLAPTLIKLTHLWFSNDPEDMLRCRWLSLELNSAGKWLRFEDPWPIWNNRFWKGVFWFDPFKWVVKEWPVNASILHVSIRHWCPPPRPSLSL